MTDNRREAAIRHLTDTGIPRDQAEEMIDRTTLPRESDPVEAAWDAMWDQHEDAADYCGFNRVTFDKHRIAIEAAIRSRPVEEGDAIEAAIEGMPEDRKAYWRSQHPARPVEEGHPVVRNALADVLADRFPGNDDFEEAADYVLQYVPLLAARPVEEGAVTMTNDEMRDLLAATRQEGIDYARTRASRPVEEGDALDPRLAEAVIAAHVEGPGGWCDTCGPSKWPCSAVLLARAARPVEEGQTNLAAGSPEAIADLRQRYPATVAAIERAARPVEVDPERLARLAYEDRPPTGSRPVPWTPEKRKAWTAWSRRILAALSSPEPKKEE